jgi:multiple sugar transport system permease protein
VAQKGQPAMAVTDIGASAGSRGVLGLVREWRQQRREPKRTNPLGYVFIAPALILYLIFNIWPMIRGFVMAFTDYRFVYPDSQWAFNGLENFAKMFADKKALAAFGITLKYAVVVLPLVIVIALAVAVLISRVKIAAPLFRWVVYLPSVLPVAVSFLMFRELFGAKFGFINQSLRNFGVANPPQWLQQVPTALPTLGAAHIWIIFGFPTLLFLIGIYNIGSELYEAASLDGASGRQQFRFITLPLLRPTFTVVITLLLPGIILITDPMVIVTQGGPQDSTKTLGLYLYQTAFQTGDLRLGYAAAISLMLSLLISVAVIVVFWLTRERN